MSRTAEKGRIRKSYKSNLADTEKQRPSNREAHLARERPEVNKHYESPPTVPKAKPKIGLMKALQKVETS